MQDDSNDKPEYMIAAGEVLSDHELAEAEVYLGPEGMKVTYEMRARDTKAHLARLFQNTIAFEKEKIGIKFPHNLQYQTSKNIPSCINRRQVSKRVNVSSIAIYFEEASSEYT